MKEHLEVFFQNPWSYIFGFILLGLFYYFKKKLENLADKGDVANITREVELVKKEFNEDLEKLKVNLDVLKINKISLINEKKKAVYEFWINLDSYDGKLDSFLNANIKSDIDKNNYLLELDKQHELFRSKSSMLNLVLFEEIDDDVDGIILDVFDTLSNKEKTIRNTLLSIVKLHIDKNNFDYKKLLTLYLNTTNQNKVLDEKLLSLKIELRNKFVIILKNLHNQTN